MPEPIQTPVPAADELAAQVLLLAQSRLTADLRFLSSALEQLKPIPSLRWTPCLPGMAAAYTIAPKRCSAHSGHSSLCPHAPCCMSPCTFFWGIPFNGRK